MIVYGRSVEKQRPLLTDLTHVATLACRQLASGDHGVTVADVDRWLHDGDLWEQLERVMPGFDHFGVIVKQHSPSTRGELLIQSLREVRDMNPNESKNLGVHDDRHGLALVVMLAITAISERLWMEPVSAPLPPDHRGPIPTN